MRSSPRSLVQLNPSIGNTATTQRVDIATAQAGALAASHCVHLTTTGWFLVRLATAMLKCRMDFAASLATAKGPDLQALEERDVVKRLRLALDSSAWSAN